MTENQKQTKARYRASKTKPYSFECYYSTEGDIINHLNKQPNKSGYIKGLIRKDIENEDA